MVITFHTDIRLRHITYGDAKNEQRKLSIYYRTQSNIRVKSYCCLNLLRASVFNYQRLDILRDLIGHPSQNLLSFDFSQSFRFQFRASRYPTGHNQTSDSKVIVYLHVHHLYLPFPLFRYTFLGRQRNLPFLYLIIFYPYSLLDACWLADM